MTELKNPIEFSALLTSLKSSVINSSLLLMEMLKDDKKEITIGEDDSKDIVALLMYDALVHETINYSILSDFDFTKEGKILLINLDKDKVKKNIEFILEYLYYRIEAPIDLASC